MPHRPSLAVIAWPACWLPRSLWKITPAPGSLRNQAIVSASVTMSAVMRGLIDQPTISRLNRSITIARYRQASPVWM